MDADSRRQELLALTTEIVGAFVGNNTVATSDLPALISSVFQALGAVGQAEPEKPAEAPTPAVPIKKSVQQDFIICLEDGKKLKMLKRHLASQYHMTPADYRRRWGLAKDYPMVAPAYAEARSALAKQIGLGRKPAAPVAPEPPAAKAAAAPPPRVGGRRKAAA
jgi:predicted transcriptional regulator